MKSYKYTHSSEALTEAQRQFYEENGYILIKNNVNHALIDELRQHFIDICDGKADPGTMTVMRDPSLKNKGVKGEYLINKVQNWLFDEIFFKYTSYGPVVDVVRSIIGPNVTAFHSMLINKPPNAHPGASLHPMHQDLHYFPFRPAERTVASWTAMERVDETNGCLYVVPGTHKGGLLPHEYPEGYKNAYYHGVQGLDHLPKVNVIMDKGDTVFFHPLILHGSGPNRSKGFRKAISCHYADSNSWFIDVRGTSQEGIAVEIQELSAKHGAVLTYDDYWKTKSRLVCGMPGEFQRMGSHL